MRLSTTQRHCRPAESMDLALTSAAVAARATARLVLFLELLFFIGTWAIATTHVRERKGCRAVGRSCGRGFLRNPPRRPICLAKPRLSADLRNARSTLAALSQQR